MNILNTARSALFSPTDRPERAAKALASTADLVILDLEDAVAPDNKDTARGLLRTVLTPARERTGVVVRINEPDSAVGVADLAELSGLARDPDLPAFAVMVPKLTRSTPLEQIPAEIPVIGLIETADAVRDLYELAALPRISRLALGAVDLSNQLGCESVSATIDAVRAQLVTASVAAGIAAPLESPCVNFRDPEVMAAAARRARRDGFGGMLCIHPAQLAAVSAAFQPSEEELSWARRVLELGDAAASIDGEMVDRPVILRAQRILTAAH